MTISLLNASSLTTFFFSPAVMLTAAAIYMLLAGISKMLPGLASNKVYARLLPILPEIIGISSTFMHLYTVPVELRPWGLQHVVIGAFIGMLSSKAYKIIDQTLLGNDANIKPA